MTKIRFKPNPVWHETGLVDRGSGRPICVAETPAALLVRLKGTRTTVKLPWSLAYLRAAELEANEIRAQRKARRRSVRRGVLSSRAL